MAIYGLVEDKFSLDFYQSLISYFILVKGGDWMMGLRMVLLLSLFLIFLSSCFHLDTPDVSNQQDKGIKELQDQLEGVTFNNQVALSKEENIVIAVDTNYSNLWAITSEHPPKPLLDVSMVDKIQKELNTKFQGEDKRYVVRANNPFVSKDSNIYFESNYKHVLESHNRSIHKLIYKNLKEEVLVDGATTGTLEIVGIRENKLFANNHTNYDILIVDLNTNEIKSCKAGGIVKSIEMDGSSVIFNKIKDAYLLKEEWRLNPNTCDEELIEK